jgi:triacylglycerol esterase/lipase EstA (alpha/beta hydrolase family)
VWLILLPAAILLVATHFQALVGFAVSAADRGEQVRLDARTVGLLVREACARSVLFLVHPLGLGQSSPVRSASAQVPEGVERGRVPVVLVPGHGQNRAALQFLRVFLQSRGWEWVWPVNVSSRDSTLADMAAELGRRVDDLRRVTGAEQVDIVGHSLGGLVAAWYVHHLEGETLVRRMVTLGAPWQGTRMAVFSRSKVASEIGLGAPVLDGLAPPPVPTVSVWSPHDNLVVPCDSAAPEGAEAVCIEGLGHTEMLLSTRVFRAVQAALSHLPSTMAATPEEASSEP